MPRRPPVDPRFEAWLSRSISRRSLLVSSAMLCAMPYAKLVARGAALISPRWTASPFTLGVASGDPTPTGVVLWTRLALDPINGGGLDPAPVPVSWEIASDDRMRQIVKKGTERPRRVGALGPRRGRRARAGSLVLVSLHDAATRRARSAARARCRSPASRARSLAVRVRLVPALRAGSVHRLRAYGAGGRRPVVPPRRLHLRERGRGRPRPQARRARSSTRSRTIGTATRSTRPTRTCRRRTRALPVVRDLGRSRGARTTTPTTSPERRRPTRRVSPPARRRVPGLLRAPCRFRRTSLPRGPTCSSTGGAAGARSRVPRARHAAVPHGSAVRRRHQGAVRRKRSTRRPRSWATSRNGGSSTACASPPRGGTCFRSRS